MSLNLDPEQFVFSLGMWMISHHLIVEHEVEHTTEVILLENLFAYGWVRISLKHNQ